MLEHQKLILQNLSTNKDMFRKELIKSLSWLNTYEQAELRKWLRKNYWNTHKDLIEKVFASELEKSITHWN